MFRLLLMVSAEELRGLAHRLFGCGPCEYPPSFYDYSDAPRRCDLCGKVEQ